MELVTEKELQMLESICEQAQSHDWIDFAGNGKSHRTHIGYAMKSSEGVTVNIPLFESNTNANRADILVAIYAKNYLPLLLRELRRSRHPKVTAAEQPQGADAMDAAPQADGN